VVPQPALTVASTSVLSVEGPLDRDEFTRWREEADRALRHGELAAGEGLHNWACFSAEQAAQLAIKALLHGLGRGPWGHDLVGLGEGLTAAGLAVPEDVRDGLLRLARHYMPARYPDAHAAGSPGGRYGPADSTQALSDARAVIGLIDGAWAELDR
jgi:HEPN domain-containing protein